MKFIFSIQQTINFLVILSLIFFVFAQTALAIPDDGNSGTSNNTDNSQTKNDSDSQGTHEQKDRDLDPQGGQHSDRKDNKNDKTQTKNDSDSQGTHEQKDRDLDPQGGQHSDRKDNKNDKTQTKNDSGSQGTHEQKDRDLDPQGGQHKDGWIKQISDIFHTIVNKTVNGVGKIYEVAKSKVTVPKEQTLTFGLDDKLPKIPRLTDDPELSFNLPEIPKDLLLLDREQTTFTNGEFPISYSTRKEVRPSDQIYIEAGPYFSGYYSMYTPLNLDNLSYEQGIYELQQEAAKSAGEVYAYYIRRVDSTGFWWKYGGDSLDGNYSVKTNINDLFTDGIPTELNDPGTTVILVHTHPDLNFQSGNMIPSLADLTMQQMMTERKIFSEVTVAGLVVTSTGGWIFFSEEKNHIDAEAIQKWFMGGDPEIYDDETVNLLNEFLDIQDKLPECSYKDCDGITKEDRDKINAQLQLIYREALELYRNNGYIVKPLHLSKIYRS